LYARTPELINDFADGADQLSFWILFFSVFDFFLRCNGFFFRGKGVATMFAKLFTFLIFDITILADQHGYLFKLAL
jgi:hypothetical protein